MGKKKAAAPVLKIKEPKRVRVVKFQRDAEAWARNGVAIGDVVDVVRSDMSGPIGTLRVWIRDPNGKPTTALGCLLIDEFEAVEDPVETTAEAMFDQLPEVPANRRETRSPESFAHAREVYSERYAAKLGVALEFVATILLDDGSIVISSEGLPSLQVPENTSLAGLDALIAETLESLRRPQTLGGYTASQLAAWYGANGFSLEDTTRAIAGLGYSVDEAVVRTHHRKGASGLSAVVSIEPEFVAKLEAAAAKPKRATKKKGAGA